MMKGRKPVPTKLKLLHGTYRNDRANKNEIRPPVPNSTPYPPRFMNREAKAEWQRMVKLLMQLGLYTECDRAALTMYCQAWGRWVKAEVALAKQGEILTSKKDDESGGGSYQNPWRHEANKAQDQIKRMLAEFGLTPSSRARLMAPQVHEADPFAEFLAKTRTGTDGGEGE